MKTTSEIIAKFNKELKTKLIPDKSEPVIGTLAAPEEFEQPILNTQDK